MADDSLDLDTNGTSKPLTPMQLFMAKLAALTVAALVFLFVAISMLDNFIATNADKLAVLKGGPAFWNSVELKLYALANERDIAPDKKAKIIDALKRINERYRPYFEAAGVAPAAPKSP